MSGANACGGCTACCTLMKVEMDPPKPAREACRFCVRGGCSIYETRPEPCQVWACVWLVSQARPERLPSALRPDRSGVVLEVNSKNYLIAHSATDAAWKRDPMYRFLLRVAAQTKVMIDLPESVLLLKPGGATEELQFVGLAPDSNERLDRRAG